MKYLFYDLEFACSSPSHRICEFGYVMTDENFKVVDEDNLLVNPNIPRKMWEERVKRDIIKRPYSEYDKASKFDELFDKIISKFKEADYVFGHTCNCDALGLNDECRRYKLPSIDHVFYDIKYMYKVFTGINREVGLDNILKELDVIGEVDSHIAQNDAYNTMVALRTMLERKQVSLDKFLEMCPKSKNKNENYIVESIARNKQLRLERAKHEQNYILKGSKNEESFKDFIIKSKPNKEGNDLFKNKIVCISGIYEKKHFKEMLNLIQMIKNEGGIYSTSSKLCDVFVKLDETDEGNKCKRFECVRVFNEMNENKKEIIYFSDLLKMFNISNEDLQNLPLPDGIKLEAPDPKSRFRHRHDNRKKIEEKPSYNQLSYSLGVELSMFCYSDID